MYAHALDSSDLGDADLIAAFQCGNDAALETLLRRHADDLYRFCRHLVPNREDAEDICQESLVRAIDRVETLQSGAAFRGWLFRIARNLSVDWFRSGRRICSLPDEERMELQVDGPDEHVEVGEECRQVSLAFRNLKESHRKVLVLREVESLSYAEIGTRLNLSQSAVETLLFRARRRLREEYARTSARAAGLPETGLRAIAFRFAAPLAGCGSAAAKVALTAAVGSALVVGPHLSRSSHPPGRSSVFQTEPPLAQQLARPLTTPRLLARKPARPTAPVAFRDRIAPQRRAFSPRAPRFFDPLADPASRARTLPQATFPPAQGTGSHIPRVRRPAAHGERSSRARSLVPASQAEDSSSGTAATRPPASPATTLIARVSVDARLRPAVSIGAAIETDHTGSQSIPGLAQTSAGLRAALPVSVTVLRAPVVLTRVSPSLVVVARGRTPLAANLSPARFTSIRSVWPLVVPAALVPRSR